MLRVSQNVRSTKTRDGGVLLDVGSGQMFSLNPVGSRVLGLIERGQEEAEIAATISKEFPGGIETARTDVRQFLQSLSELGLIG
jgi:hypothetical protein